MSESHGLHDDPRYDAAARADYLSALIDQERLEHALEITALKARLEALGLHADELAAALNEAYSNWY